MPSRKKSKRGSYKFSLGKSKKSNKLVLIIALISFVMLFFTFYGEASRLVDFDQLVIEDNFLINATSFNITNGTEDFMTITQQGKVGIGTDKPGDAKLNVSGVIDAWDVMVNGSTVRVGGGWTDDGGIVRLTTTGDTVGIGISNPPGGKLYVEGNGTFTGDVVIGGDLVGTEGAGASGADGLGWVDDGTIVRLATSTDRVGIGTSSPTHALNVDGNVNFTGNLTVGNINKGVCPPGYVLVPGNASFVEEDFCMMKYEAKNHSDYNFRAISTASYKPWTSISQYGAKIACQNAGAHLCTNGEWMTAARNIEAQPENWVGGVVGTGCMYGGHMECDAAPCTVGWNASTDDNEGYWNETANHSSTTSNCPFALDEGRGVETKRTFTLSNGEVIWDLSGNVWEWTDGLCGDPWSTVAAWAEYSSLTFEKYVAGSISYDSNNGVGKYYGCITAGNAFRRGGSWNHGSNAGVFALTMSDVPSSVVSAYRGFRCCQ